MLKYLGVVLLERHLEVEAGELRHVAVRVRVLRAEDGAHLEDAVEVRHQRHLLVELRRLRHVGVAAKVLDLEDVGAALRRRRDHLGRVDLDEALRGEPLAEEGAHLRLDAEDALVGRRAQVEHAVVQPHVLVDARPRFSARRRRRRLGRLLGRRRLGPRGVLELERELRDGAADAEDLLDLQLDELLRARRDRHVGARHLGAHVDDRLLRQRAGEGDDRGLAAHHRLHRVDLLAELEERERLPCFRDVATRARTHTSLPLSGGASAATRSQLRPDLVSDLMKRLPNECSPYVSSVSDGPSADSSFFACAFARSAWRAAFSAAFFALASRSAAFFASRAAASSSGV